MTEIEAVPGGAIRARHALTNLGGPPYLVGSLEVVFPLPGRIGEVLDFTGRQTAERIPQRHRIGDGLWLREGRRGHTGHDSATVLVAGVPGFTFGRGEVFGLHVAWSGNTVHRVERVPSGLGMASDGLEGILPGVTTIGGGELLLPGEISLAEGESYTTPWVYLAAGQGGLDDLSAQFHGYLRAQPAHPGSPRPVNLNVWEAVYFRHDLGKLTALADAAAGLGVERFVLDDGWFTGRRSDRAGLGDWRVDEDVWPGGLHRLVGYVRDRGMQFGLWIEPEMVNPDSGLYRAHPDWILAAGHRGPPLQRHQLVLDLTRPEVSGYLLERIGALLSEYEISYVKWDCNRDIVDAGSGARGGAPAAHAQALAVYALLDELRARHPQVEWESCAAGGGRIDLAMLERVQRVWTSDMTDALARQPIQRWTGQLVPPEYLGAHVSASFSHQTGRYMPMSLRGATALYGHLRHRGRHHPARPGRARRAGRLDRAVQAAPRAHPLRPRGQDRHPGRHGLDARRRSRGPVRRPGQLRAAGRAGKRPARRPAGPRARPGAALPGQRRDTGAARAPAAAAWTSPAFPPSRSPAPRWARSASRSPPAAP